MKEDINRVSEWDAIELPIHRLIKSLYSYILKQSKDDDRVDVRQTPFLNLLIIKDKILYASHQCENGIDISNLVEQCYGQDIGIPLEVYNIV